MAQGGALEERSNSGADSDLRPKSDVARKKTGGRWTCAGEKWRGHRCTVRRPGVTLQKRADGRVRAQSDVARKRRGRRWTGSGEQWRGHRSRAPTFDTEEKPNEGRRSGTDPMRY